MTLPDNEWIDLGQALESYSQRLGLSREEWAPVRHILMTNGANQIWLGGHLFELHDTGSGPMLDRAQFDAMLETVAGAEEP